MSEPKKKRPYLVKGADGQTIAVPAGEYYISVKGKRRRMMRESLSKEGRQIYDCVELATVGYRREVAVITEATAEGKRRRRLTISDISRQTGIGHANIRRVFRKELEPKNLIFRRGIDGKPPRKGKIEIVAPANPGPFPQPPDGTKRGRARPQFPEWIPKSWDSLKAFARREKAEFRTEIEGARDLIPEGEEISRDLEKLYLRVRAFLPKVCAPANSTAHIKKERKAEIQTDKPLPELQELPTPEEKPVRPFVISSSEKTAEAETPASPQPAAPSPESPSLEIEIQPVRPFVVSPPSLKELVHVELARFTLPTKLNPEMLDQIMAYIPDEGVLEQFRKAIKDTGPDAVDRWTYFRKVARLCNENREMYAIAKSAHTGARETGETQHTGRSKATEGAMALAARRAAQGFPIC